MLEYSTGPQRALKRATNFQAHPSATLPTTAERKAATVARAMVPTPVDEPGAAGDEVVLYTSQGANAKIDLRPITTRRGTLS